MPMFKQQQLYGSPPLTPWIKLIAFYGQVPPHGRLRKNT